MQITFNGVKLVDIIAMNDGFFKSFKRRDVKIISVCY